MGEDLSDSALVVKQTTGTDGCSRNGGRRATIACVLSAGPQTHRHRWLPHADDASSASLVVEVLDTHSASVQRALLRRQAPFANGTRTAQPLESRDTVPMCNQCLMWGHWSGACRSGAVFCEKCGERHLAFQHNQVATCCRSEGVAAGEPCRHIDFCINCRQAHRATSRLCPFFVHRHDREWHRSHTRTPAPRPAPQPDADGFVPARPQVRFAPPPRDSEGANPPPQANRRRRGGAPGQGGNAAASGSGTV